MKNEFRKINVTLGLVTFLFLLSFMGGNSAFAAKEIRYTKYNIHTQAKGSQFNASYANYTNPGAGHFIIPAGSEITLLRKKRKEFRFRVNGDGKEVRFLYHEPRMGMSVSEYIEKITSIQPVSLDQLSELDRKGVREGKALVGMTRKGVMTALGYPAAHRTPTLESPSWTYWTNRFGTVVVDFDGRGKVKEVRD